MSCLFPRLACQFCLISFNDRVPALVVSDPRNTVVLVPFPLWAGKEREEMKARPSQGACNKGRGGEEEEEREGKE